MHVVTYLEMAIFSFPAFPPPCLDPGTIIYVLFITLGMGGWHFASVFSQLALQSTGQQLGTEVLR